MEHTGSQGGIGESLDWLGGQASTSAADTLARRPVCRSAAKRDPTGPAPRVGRADPPGFAASTRRSLGPDARPGTAGAARVPDPRGDG